MPFGLGGANLPDLPNIDAQLNLFTQMMDEFGRIAKERQAKLGPLEDEFLGSITDLINRFAPEAAKQFNFADELRTLYQRQALPQEQRLFRDLQGYDTAARRADQAARAAGGVVQAANAQQQAMTRDLRQAGVDPNDPRYAAMRAQETADVAAQAAAAGKSARDQVEEEGIQRRIAATQLGQTWNALSNTYLGQGVQLAAAVPTALQGGLQTAANIGGRPIDYQRGQLDLANSYIDQMMRRYEAKLGRAALRSSASAGLGGALGSLAGAAGGFYLGGGFGGGLNALRGASLGAGLFGGGFRE